MEELLRHLVAAIIDHPEDIQIERKDRRHGTVLELRVHPDDMGRVIGRGGRRAQAIRQVMKAKGLRTGERIFVDIVD